MCTFIYIYIYTILHLHYFLFMYTIYHVVISFHCIFKRVLGCSRNLSTNCQIVIPFTSLVLKLDLSLVSISFLLLAMFSAHSTKEW